jgi:DNA-binding transcriptional ArsR family regulator
MQQPATSRRGSDAGSARRGDRVDGTESLEPTAVLELLGDEFTRDVLQALGDGPRTGREILDATDVSRPTVYRRLNRLQEAGLVEAETKIRQNGHHCKQFRLVVEQFDFGLDADGFSVDARADADRMTERGTLRIETGRSDD